MTNNVIAFPNRKVIARSKNRKEALSVIVPRLKELMAKGRTEIDGMQLLYAAIPDGGSTICFHISEAGNLFMSGHINHPGKALFINGETVIVANKYIPDVVIMSWKRGDWEARLFTDPPLTGGSSSWQ